MVMLKSIVAIGAVPMQWSTCDYCYPGVIETRVFFDGEHVATFKVEIERLNAVSFLKHKLAKKKIVQDIIRRYTGNQNEKARENKTSRQIII